MNDITRQTIIFYTYLLLTTIASCYVINVAKATPKQLLLICLGFCLIQPLSTFIYLLLKEVFTKWKEF